MPEMTITPSLPQSLPGVTAAAGAAASATDAPAPAAAAAGADFAVILGRQLAQSPRDADAALCASLQSQSDRADGKDTQGDATAFTDLDAMLPALAALIANQAATVPQPAGSTTPAGADASVPAARGSALLAGKLPELAPAPASVLSRTDTQPFSPTAADRDGVAAEGKGVAATALPAVFAAATLPAAEAAAAVPAARELPRDAAAETPAAGVQPHAVMPQMHAGTAAETTSAMRIDAPLGAPGWSQEVAQKVVWLAGRDENRAELTLNPPHLGKIEVTLTVSGDQTNALFVSASQAARDALENALPRLRETLADAGITLGQASVNAESSQGGGNGDEAAQARGGSAAAAVQAAAAPSAWIRRGNGLVDTFA